MPVENKIRKIKNHQYLKSCEVVKMDKLIELSRGRIANVSVGASTVRGQKKGTVKVIRDFLIKIDLSLFKNIDDENSFQIFLDKLTDKLIIKMPEGNFGFARKCLNIFLFEVCQNKLLSNEFGLDKIIPFLEVPLDNPNEKELGKQAKGLKDWEWNSIKRLNPEDNKKIQSFAKKYMKQFYNLGRVHFDLINWRNDNK